MCIQVEFLHHSTFVAKCTCTLVPACTYVRHATLVAPTSPLSCHVPNTTVFSKTAIHCPSQSSTAMRCVNSRCNGTRTKHLSYCSDISAPCDSVSKSKVCVSLIKFSRSVYIGNFKMGKNRECDAL